VNYVYRIVLRPQTDDNDEVAGITVGSKSDRVWECVFLDELNAHYIPVANHAQFVIRQIHKSLMCKILLRSFFESRVASHILDSDHNAVSQFDATGRLILLRQYPINDNQLDGVFHVSRTSNRRLQTFLYHHYQQKTRQSRVFGSYIEEIQILHLEWHSISINHCYAREGCKRRLQKTT
jgi:hypothetical protein